MAMSWKIPNFASDFKTNSIMSSSLFYDCYAQYESYPFTTKIDGDTTFGELKEGDKLYFLRPVFDKETEEEKYEVVTLDVIKPWHKAKGHCFITCQEGEKKHYIDFGPANCANVLYDSKNSSIVYYDKKFAHVSTNVISLVNYRIDISNKEIEKLENQINAERNTIEKLVACAMEKYNKQY